MIFDTDILIWLQQGNLSAQRLINRSSELYISTMTHLEMLQGAKDKRHLSILESFFKTFNFKVLPLTENIGRLAVYYLKTYRLSHSLSAADALIAATAAEHGLTLCSGNVKHFRQIANLSFHAFKP